MRTFITGGGAGGRGGVEWSKWGGGDAGAREARDWPRGRNHCDVIGSEPF